jgi:hypothetical protein
MYRKMGVVLGLIIALLAGGVVMPTVSAYTPPAQGGSAPLVFLKDGDLWKWDGSAVTQLTTWGYNERPVLSPNGQRIAYNSWAQITIDAIAAGKPVGGLIPSNIWVIDPVTGNANRVADQPPGATFNLAQTDYVIMRGTPVWSPDSNKLAWAELVSPDFVYRLVVYDFMTGTQSVIVSGLPFPFADGGFIPVHEVLWGNRGILVRNVAVNNLSAEFEERAYLYAPDGTLIHEMVIGSSAAEWVYNVQWTMSNGQQYLGLVYPSGKRYLVDPATGDQQDMPALPELYSTLTPGGSATAFVGASVDASGGVSNTWTAVYPDRQQDQMLSFAGEPKSIAVSPDGQAVAYISDAVYVWRNGSSTRIPGTEGIASPWEVGLVWGPNAWRVRTDWPTGSPSGGGLGGGAVACTLPPRLAAGGSGQVTPGLPNLLRAQPWRGMDSLILGRIPAGGVFSVISGPQCDNEGRYWWQVNYNGVTGWTAEGEYGVYWLQPVGINPPPVACTLTPRLTPGTTAYVTPGLPNVIRTQPRRGPDSVIIGIIPGSGVFSVISGPQCDNDGRYWWQVNYAGITGWTAEGENGVYWLAPFGCPNSPAPRLAPTMQARVTPGLPNRLRSGPGSNYGQIASIPAGGVFTVLSGPQCGPEGWSYWRVQYGSTIGWTAEGDGSAYWLEPLGWNVPLPMPPTPTPPPRACTLAPRLTAGTSAYVIPGPSNVIRNAPGTGSNSSVIGQIPGGAFFYVTGNPQCGNDGRYWWPIRYQGVSGWTGEGEGSNYWVSPFVCSNSPATRLIPGGFGRVLPGLPNAIRNAPGTGSSSVVIGEIPGGGGFSVIGGPQCGNDGRTWWQVNYSGMTGWTAEGEGGAYWVEPVFNPTVGD